MKITVKTACASTINCIIILKIKNIVNINYITNINKINISEGKT